MTSSRRLGPWRLLEFLGEGSTGRVFAATDGQRHAAVKVVRPLRALRPGEVEEAWVRLGERLRVLASVDHPGVIRILDWGHDRADVELWYAMERLQGRGLSVSTAPGVATLLPLAERLARGLAAVHATGTVHGDLKPANLFREPSGRAVIVDFALPVLAEQVTSPAGSPRWMAPECLGGRPTTPAADVYALCQSLGELAVGRPLFPAHGRGPARLLHLMKLKASADAVDPGVDAGPLRAMVQAGTARRPSDRPSAAELARSLAALQGGGSGTPA